MKNDKCDRRFDCDDYKYDHCEGCGGNKPYGDLISREALLEAIRKKLGISSLNFLTEQEKVIVEEINNAPTVETDIEEVGKDAYKQGYTDGWKERFGEPNERPQGEWKIIEHETQYLMGIYQCNLCSYKYICPDEFARNYCPNCGAYMRGDDNEQ